MKKNSERKIRRIFSYFKPYWKQWLFIFLISLIYAGLTLVNPLILRFLIDDVLIQQDFYLLNLVILAFILISIFSITTGVIVSYLYKKLELSILFDIRNQLFEHLESLDMGFFYEERMGDILSRITEDVGGIEEFISTVFNDLLMSLILLSVSVFIAFYLAWEMALLAVSTMIPIIIIQKHYGNIIRKQYKSVRIRAADFLSFLQERLSIVMLTKTFSREEYELSAEKSKAKKLIEKELQLTLTQSIMTAVIGMITFGVMLFILWFGGVKVIVGVMTIGTLIAIYTYILQMFGPLETLVDINISLKTTMVSVDRVFEFFNKKPKVKEKPDAKELGDVLGKIELKNISFSYRPKRKVLENISLEINPGEKVAIVGPTGAGKSTIGSLITRLYDPDKGKITVSGHDLKDVKIKSLRKNIGVVSQNVALFHASIRENIAYGKLKATKKEIMHAAKTAGIHDFVKTLPKGYETSVGERGAELSGGEAQRIAIARVALKNPDLIILDEATSSLDMETEKQVQENLKELTKGKTTLVIAHRLSTVKNADRIYFLDRKKIVEKGTFDELMKKKGRFWKMHESQN